MYLKEMRPYQLADAVARGLPLLVPAGCIEYHGPHMALGNDTYIAEELCKRLDERVDLVIAPSFEYGATGYAVSGPDKGTIDIDNGAFEAYVKSVLRAFLDLGFQRIAVIIHHQGMDGPLALAFRKAAAELSMERPREQHGLGWWGELPPEALPGAFGHIRVAPTILPAAREVAGGDHAGLYETSYLLAARPDLVEMDRLQAGGLPWFCTRPENPSAEGTAELGERMFAAMVGAWEAELRGWRV
ncbi:MAG: creatininase family protein [Chloroflexi bacterium]|jgi:creatinine amidohydrolase|nr:creatininase family protein [Chloroflexota bacterium]